MKANAFFTMALLLFVLVACEGQKRGSESKASDSDVSLIPLKPPAGKAIAAFAEGCFWCSEHIFEAVVGVDSAISGYAGGTTKNPTYEIVNTETTGHAETVLVYYNPKVVSYEELTKVFFTSHDPTTKNSQGPDHGSSYRSILFYLTAEEKAIAEKSLESFEKSGLYKTPIVSEIKKLTEFYRAEGYHQDFIAHNPNQSYVRGVSIPRFELFKKTYKGKLK